MSQVAWFINTANVSRMLPISNNKTCMLLLYRLPTLGFVDKRFEISNLDLIRDMNSVIKLEEVLSIMK
jgi:hypothetical protein